MRVTWQTFDGVEAQVYEPEEGTRAAILFCPGFPGMGATIFEQRHAAALVDQGYAVYVIKHKGTKLYGPMAPVMVNNAARLMRARGNRETHLGGGAATIHDWMVEPSFVLKALDEKYDAVHVIGNSFGALSAMWSMAQDDAAIGKVKSLLLYAGAQGVWEDGNPESIARIWRPDFLRLPRITEKVELNDPAEIVDNLKEFYMALPERVKALPKSIPITYLVVEQDEILRMDDTSVFDDAIGGRGVTVVDRVDHAWPDHGFLAHDTTNYQTEDLLELIRT